MKKNMKEIDSQDLIHSSFSHSPTLFEYFYFSF